MCSGAHITPRKRHCWSHAPPARVAQPWRSATGRGTTALRSAPWQPAAGSFPVTLCHQSPVPAPQALAVHLTLPHASSSLRGWQQEARTLASSWRCPSPWPPDCAHGLWSVTLQPLHTCPGGRAGTVPGCLDKGSLLVGTGKRSPLRPSPARAPHPQAGTSVQQGSFLAQRPQGPGSCHSEVAYAPATAQQATGSHSTLGCAGPAPSPHTWPGKDVREQITMGAAAAATSRSRPPRARPGPPPSMHRRKHLVGTLAPAQGKGFQ